MEDEYDQVELEEEDQEEPCASSLDKMDMETFRDTMAENMWQQYLNYRS
jgi:hypothetical protein